MKKKYRKAGCLIIAGAMILSGVGCGKKDDKVVDYGVDPSNPTVTSASASSPGDGTESFGLAKTTSETLQEQFGESVSWQDSFSVQNCSIETSKVYKLPSNEYLNKYDIQYLDATTEGEQEFADKFFDDGATKLEEIKYTDDTKYMIQMYKYRHFLHQLGLVDVNFDELEAQGMDDFMSVWDEDISVITADSDIDYKWIDEDDYAIHMYEGKYNGVNFGLIIAYDFAADIKAICFEPTDIKEYFPDANYQSLMLENSIDTTGASVVSDNKCTMSESDVMDEARELVTSRLGLGEYDSEMCGDSSSYDSVLASYVYSETVSKADAGISIMSFSDGDVVSTIDTCHSYGGLRSLERLAEQDDPVAEYKEDYKEDYWAWAFYGAASNKTYKDDSVTSVVDGYAVYLKSPFSIEDTSNEYVYSYSGSTSSNVGCVMFTSKGLFGMEVMLGAETTDVTEGVALADFETIKQSCMDALDENLDLAALKNPKNMNLSSFSLVYEYKDTEDAKKAEVVPAWSFDFSCNNGEATVVIDAMDGSLVNYYEYTYSF